LPKGKKKTRLTDATKGLHKQMKELSQRGEGGKRKNEQGSRQFEFKTGRKEHLSMGREVFQYTRQEPMEDLMRPSCLVDIGTTKTERKKIERPI